MRVSIQNLGLDRFPTGPVVGHDDSRTVSSRIFHKLIKPPGLKSLIGQDEVVSLHRRSILAVVVVAGDAV